MAKDEHGYGSNGRAGNDLVNHVRDTDALRVATNAAIGKQRAMFATASGGQPMSSNAVAAQSLMSGLKSTQAPVHDSMAHMWTGSDAFGRDADFLHRISYPKGK